MPTGYTAAVCDGKITEFKDFALSCARAFGALITMRDDPMDAPIPNEFKPSTFNADRLTEAKARLHDLQAMTPEQAEHAAFRDFEERKAHADEANARYDAENERIDAMLEKVNSWEPPTEDHREMKSFMIQQLTISKSDYRAEQPERLNGAAWLAREAATAARDVGYHTKAQLEENERATKRTAWIRDLRASLDAH